MDNHDRRVGYARQNHPELSREQCAALATGLYLAGREDLLGLKPGQARRVRHKRGRAHGPGTRGANPQAAIPDEAAGPAGDFEFRAADMRPVSRAGRMSGALAQVSALLDRAGKPARARR